MDIKGVCGKLREATMIFSVLGGVGLVAGVICLVVGTGNDTLLAVAGLGSIAASVGLMGCAALFVALGQLVSDVNEIKEKMKKY